MEKKKIISYILFSLSILPLWLMVLIIALELAAVSLKVWQEKHNPLIRAFITEGYIPQKASLETISDHHFAKPPGG